MITYLTHKGYTGSIDYSPADKVYYGKVQGIAALVSYDGPTFPDAEADFRDAVDDYLALCRANHEPPERPRQQNEAQLPVHAAQAHSGIM